MEAKVSYAVDDLEKQISGITNKERKPVMQEKSTLSDSKSHKSKSVRSNKSQANGSLRSKSSTASSNLIKHQANLEAAKVRHRYTERESEIMIKRAALEADLKLLNSKRDIDEAETKVKTIRDMLEEDADDEFGNSSLVNQSIIRQRTEEFVTDSCERLADLNRNRASPEHT